MSQIKPFMDENFLLTTETSRHLYHDHAAKMPIIDYHCHLSPKMIAEDYRFKSITELWLGGDHYKWRALRANGVDEKYITGDADDWDEFAPKFEWTPIGQGIAFGGHFIGKDPETEEIHSISGLYLNTSTTNTGLFAKTANGSSIENLKLENSYFYSSAGRVGSIAGEFKGILNTVYSDAIVVSSANYAGGLIAMASNDNRYDVDIINSWFNILKLNTIK